MKGIDLFPKLDDKTENTVAKKRDYNA